MKESTYEALVVEGLTLEMLEVKALLIAGLLVDGLIVAVEVTLDGLAVVEATGP